MRKTALEEVRIESTRKNQTSLTVRRIKGTNDQEKLVLQKMAHN